MNDFDEEYGHSEVEEYARRLRKLPELSQLSSRPEIALSFPVPSISDRGGGLLNYFHYPSHMVNGTTVQIRRPFTYVTVAMDTFELHRFIKDARVFSEILVDFPVSQHLRDVDPQVMRLQVERFYDYYDVVLKWFPDSSLSSIRSEFRNLFSEFVHSSLLPFYKALNPEFIDWLYEGG
jgi:hypothetical protein